MAEETNRQLEIYESAAGELRLKIDSEGQTVWATQDQIASLFGCTKMNVIQHVQSIIAEGELDADATVKKIFTVQSEAGREVSRNILHYNLDMILSVGYRVNSAQATRFRQWATTTLRQYIVEGYVLNEDRLANRPDELRQIAAKIRSIRTSEQHLYAKVRDAFTASASDYDPNSQAAKNFFAMAQDKLHYATTGKTAAQIILERADARKQHMGLTTIKGDEPTLAETKIAKNYLDGAELHDLENISEQFLLYLESKAFRGQPVTMEELLTKLNVLLAANDYSVLYHYGKYQRTAANQHAQKQLHAYQARLKAPKKTPRLKPGKPEGESPHA